VYKSNPTDSSLPECVFAPFEWIIATLIPKKRKESDEKIYLYFILFRSSKVYFARSWSVITFPYQLNPRGAPPLSVVKTITELLYNPLFLRAFVMFPTDSSNEATIAA